jgi:hypothetical protein
MENLILLLTASFAYYNASPKELKTLPIGNTSCSLQLLTGTEFYTTRTDEGDLLHFAEYGERQCRYGLVFGELTDRLNYEEAYTLLASYMNDLREPFDVQHHLGVRDVEKRKTNFIELTDFWQDNDGLDWEVKGYTDGRHVAVLYVKNIGALHSSRQEAFLNSFSFGESSLKSDNVANG